MSRAKEQRAVAEGVRHVLACVPGTVYYNETRTAALVLLSEDPYVVHVDKAGGTMSAYLSTIPPAEVAEAIGADEGDVGGFTGGWTC